jgi:hypothetical protein
MAWIGLVFFGNLFIPISLLMLVAHINFFVTNKREIYLIAAVTVTGIVVDSILQYANVFIFINSNHIPFWLMMLWGCFATTLCHSLGFLTKSKWLQMLVGGLFAPLSYLAGYKFQVVDFGLTMLNTYLMLSVVWAALFILFFYLKDLFVIGYDNNQGQNGDVSYE